MSKKTALPKGVWFQKKTLATGEIIRYGYLGRGPGMQALGREGSADFHFRLAEAIRGAPQDGWVSHLIWRYKSSKEFAQRAPLTQRDYRRHLDKIQAKFGKLRVAAIESAAICDHIFNWRDDLAKASPRQADYTISVLSAMLAWCKTRGLVKENRASGVGDVYTANRREKVWTEEMEARFMAVATEPMKRAMILALETGLSQEDLLVLPWSAIDGNVIVAKRLKNGTPLAVPISPKLAAMLETAPRTCDLILTTSDGKPYEESGNGLRSLFRKDRTRAGIVGRTFHDMRGTFITRRRAIGWTAEETALCSGHPIAGEQGAQSSYVDRLDVAKRNATRLWARYYRPKRERGLQTAVQTIRDHTDAKSL